MVLFGGSCWVSAWPVECGDVSVLSLSDLSVRKYDVILITFLAQVAVWICRADSAVRVSDDAVDTFIGFAMLAILLTIMYAVLRFKSIKSTHNMGNPNYLPRFSVCLTDLLFFLSCIDQTTILN